VTDRVFRGLDGLAEAARARGVAMETLALAWVLRHPQVDAAIIGPRTAAHLTSALAALDVALSADEAAALAALF
jgi:aryl-alcohol dehydrogenase-like predicted oxidoreductase